ncbi:MAG: hypothetical protein KDK26_18175 [Roseivivax sp.]|nr:hypothetical protein [Roseivivax sp.]
MAELLEIGFERLSDNRLEELVIATGLPHGFGRSDEFEQTRQPVWFGDLQLLDATAGCYPYDGAKDLEISIDHPLDGRRIAVIARQVAQTAAAAGVKVWKIGLEPLDDVATLYFSNQGPGPLWR